MARTELPNGVILPAEYSDDWYEDMTSNLTKLDDVIGSDAEKLNADGVDFLRMSSAALTDGGTGNFSDLNSSYKIKTGDLILDSGRKLYKIVSVNSTTETFTVGNSLFKVTAESDLAPVAESGDYDDLDNKPDLNPYDQHLANTEIHVTTADKNRWNNQTYVFRYSSTALVASSTNSNTLLDNTDNLKVGDKVIDSSGVLFSITAIDTQNSTFTIGTALIDLAQDSDVVHKSGDETISGTKDFSDALRIYNSNASSNTAQIWLKNSKVNRGQSVYGDQAIWFRDATDKPVTALISRVTSLGASALLLYAYNADQNNQQVANCLSFVKYLDGTCYLLPDQNNAIVLGSSTAKFKSVNTSQINGLEPSSLSLPSGNVSDVIDISSYLVNLDGTTNTYTAPANGWISISMINCSSIQAYINGLWGHQVIRPTAGVVRFFMPISKNQTASIWIWGGTIDNARFIPCQGNV